MRGEFVRFVLVGGFAAAMNWGSRLLMAAVMPLEAAVVLAYLIGMATAYGLSRILVFGQSGRHAVDEMWRFAAVNLIALAQVWLVTVGLARYGFPWVGFAWHADAVAHAIGVASPVVTSYFGHKHFTFRTKTG